MNDDGVIKFDASAKMYRNLAERRLEEDDLEGALGFLLAAKNKSKNQYSLLADIADVYFDMELYELSANYWFRALDVAPKQSLADVYNGLGACYYNMNNSSVGMYYFNEQFMNMRSSEMVIDEDMAECFTEAFAADSGYRMVYPPESVDYSGVMKAGKTALQRYNISEALELYSEVPPVAAEYDEAQLQISVAHFLSGDVDKAIEINRSVYDRDKTNVFALCNLSSMYRFKNMPMLADNYFSYVDENNAKTADELYKVATACCENGKHERAVKCFERLFIERPFNMSMMFFYGVALYNCGRYEDSRRAFGRILRITEKNPVAFYCHRLADNAVSSGAKSAKPLSYYYRLPDSEEQANLKKLAALLKTKGERSLKNKAKEPETAELIDWCFCSADKDVQRGAVFFLAAADTKATEQQLIERLLDASVYDATKEYIVLMLAAKGYEKKAGAVISNVYKKICFYAFDADFGRFGDAFIDAYAICFAKAAVYSDCNLRDVYDAAGEVYYSDAYSEFLYNADVRVLAAYIYIRAGVEKVVKISAVAELFECDKFELKKLTETDV